MAGGISHGTDEASIRWSSPSTSFSSLGLEPTELALADHHAFTGIEDAAVTRVDHDEPAAAEIPSIAEPDALVAVHFFVGTIGQVDQKRPGVAFCCHAVRW